MALNVSYDDSIDSIVIKVTGSVGYEDIFALRGSIVNYPHFRKNINQVFDCTEGELDLTTDDIKKNAFDFNDIADQLGGHRKLAVVVSRDLDFGIARQYEVFFNSGPGVAVQPFRSSSDAREWLMKDE